MVTEDHIIWTKQSKTIASNMYSDVRKQHYNLDNWIETFTDITNRSKSQTYQMYNFLNGNIHKLINLEIKLISNYISGIPITTEKIHQFLRLKINNNHPKIKDLLNLWHPWYYKTNQYFYSLINLDYKSITSSEYLKRGLKFHSYKWYETESFKSIKERLIKEHGRNLQYIFKNNRIKYNHVLTTCLNNFEHKQLINMKNINQQGFENFKTYYISSKDNTRTHLIKIGSASPLVFKDESSPAMFLLLLQKAAEVDIKTRYDFITADYDDENTFLDMLDFIEESKKSRIKVLDYQRIETIPDNNKFVKVDYLPTKNYYAASGVFTRNSKDNELTDEDAGKLILSQIVCTRPLVIKEEDLLDSIKDKAYADIAASHLQKKKGELSKKESEKLTKKINEEFNSWLNKVVLLRQKVEFDYPIKGITVKEFMEDNQINLVRYISL